MTQVMILCSIDVIATPFDHLLVEAMTCKTDHKVGFTLQIYYSCIVSSEISFAVYF